MVPVAQGTAELIAHIFQPSLRDSFDSGPCAPRTDVLGYFQAVPSGLHPVPVRYPASLPMVLGKCFGCCPN